MIVYQKTENLGEQVAAWLLQCSKSLDFVCDSKTRLNLAEMMPQDITNIFLFQPHTTQC